MSAQGFPVGRIELRLVPDGADRVPAGMILVGAPPPEVEAIARGHADAEGQLPVAYDSLLIRTDGRLVLVDAGFGELSELEGAGGELLASLASLGVDPAAIDDVIVSHGHADHIAGLTRTVEGRQVPVFERARHWFTRDEWAWWTSADSLARMHRGLADPARAALPPLAAAGLVELVTAEREVAPGVRIVPAPGHTPGHAVVVVESDGERAVYLGDAVFHLVNLSAPRLTCLFDVDPDAAARTRSRLLEEAAADGRTVLATHLGAMGRVERSGGAYRLGAV